MTGMDFYQISGSVKTLLILIPLVAFLGFLAVLMQSLLSTYRKGQAWKKSQEATVLTVEGSILSKRTDPAEQTTPSPSLTKYFVTLLASSGNQIELSLSDIDYSKLAEGDEGVLRYQGTRFLHFDHK